jgi:glycosyltransferase involved in cell wall biosynthesis
MKVLHIINNLGSGGAEKLIEEMLPLMNNEEGTKADVLLLTDNSNVFDKKLKNSGVKVDVIPLRNLHNPINIYYIRKYIIEGKYDIVHAHLFPTIYWVSIASKLIFKNKPKFVMTEHSTHNRRRERNYLRFLEKFIYASYDKIISISKRTQDNLVAWAKTKPKQTK